jgi:hypothetical protein
VFFSATTSENNQEAEMWLSLCAEYIIDHGADSETNIVLITTMVASALTIKELWVYPVKACQGIQVTSANVTATG